MSFKFRAWHNTEEDMVYMGVVKYFGQTGIIDQTVGHDDAVWMLCSNTKDSNNRDIYADDIVKYTDKYALQECVGVVRYGEYKQDGSGGEYSASSVLGFYVEAMDGQVDEDGDEIVYDFEKTQSILEVRNVKVVGNIHESPELLNQ